MESFVKETGIAAPFMRINIDTDQIVPGKELVRGRTEGYGPSLFAMWRYIGDRDPNPEFLLNQEPWRHATILLADRNFGCGSSREAAPMALRAYGFRAVIAPSFGGIFFNNSFRNGLLPVELPIEQVRDLADQVTHSGGREKLTVDLENNQVIAPNGTRYAFSTPELLRQMLLQGIDEIGLTLSRRAEIDAFRMADRNKRPWAYSAPLG